MKAIINMGNSHYLEIYKEEDIKKLATALAAPTFAPKYMFFADSENEMTVVNLNDITRVDFLGYMNEKLCKINGYLADGNLCTVPEHFLDEYKKGGTKND